jgi:SAM-dependent methyltransferase
MASYAAVSAPAAVPLPFPPEQLMHRVGHLGEGGDVAARYDALGRTMKELVVDCLPDGWSFDGRRVLDFGCGAGRLLRHFVAEAEHCDEFWGSEIDEPSVAWVTQHLGPPFKVVLNDETPPIPAPDHHFDLIYAMSVFTHITEEWAAWVLEMHRLLKPEGLLLVSLLGESMIGPLLGERWDPDRVGHLIARSGAAWDDGGPLAFVSRWWLEAHWGRAFDLLWVRPNAWDGADNRESHDMALLRARPDRPTRSELEAPADDPRELRAASYNLATLSLELGTARRELEGALKYEREIAAYWRRAAEHWERVARHWEAYADDSKREAEHIHHALAVIEESKSWRLTASLRALAQALRRLRNSI